jgi:hypothetical protein
MALHTKKDDDHGKDLKDEDVVELSSAGEDPTDTSDVDGGIDTSAAEPSEEDGETLIMHPPGPHDEGAGTIMHPPGPHDNGAGQIEHPAGPSDDAPPYPTNDYDSGDAGGFVAEPVVQGVFGTTFEGKDTSPTYHEEQVPAVEDKHSKE